MKKPVSLFVKMLLIIVPTVLLLDMVVFFIAYSMTYNNTLDQCKKTVEAVSKQTAKEFEYMDLNNEDTMESVGNYLSSTCNLTNLSYLYAIKPDLETNTETYVAIGFGENASEDVRKSHYPGYSVKGMISKQEVNALNGQLSDNIAEESNQYGYMLISYTPVLRSFDSETGEFRDGIEILIGAEMSISDIMNAFRQRFIIIAVYMIAASVVVVVIVIVILYRKVSIPARSISMRMSSFVSDREKGVEMLPVKGTDEFAQMASSFNTMVKEIDTYINDIDRLTREKHMSEAEMEIAHNIQVGLLKPVVTDRDTFSVRARMFSAKNVGGDFYDYEILDDGKVFVAVADVSGKGISAAMFMSHAVTLLGQYALMGHSPAKILEEYNNSLAQKNPRNMFITTFIAIYDPERGTLTYSNAGHNIPYVISDRLIPLDKAHGIAAGLFSGEKYENATLDLHNGDVLFMYTDGVNEAVGSEGGFYSVERLEKGLRYYIDNPRFDLVENLLCDLKDFTGNAPQSDDITMMSVEMKGFMRNDLYLKSEINEFLKFKEELMKLDMDTEFKMKIILVAEEIFVNICHYAYEDTGDILVSLVKNKGLEITFTDWGVAFDPTEGVVTMDEYDHDNTLGGLGRYLAFTVSDEYSYEYTEGKNILRLYFRGVNDGNQKGN